MDENNADVIRDDSRLFELFTELAYGVMKDYANYRKEQEKELEI